MTNAYRRCTILWLVFALPTPWTVWAQEIVKWQHQGLCILPQNIHGSWLDDQRYWKKNIPEQDSTFGSVTKLEEVCWFQVCGSIVCPPGNNYIVLMKMKAMPILFVVSLHYLSPGFYCSLSGQDIEHPFH